jgi:toxin ParE1/3/4
MITWTSAAEQDLADIALYLDREAGAEVAQRFIDALDATCALLDAHPYLGPARRLRPQVRSLRVAGFRNYLVFYEPSREGIKILRILHGMRDLNRLIGLIL